LAESNIQLQIANFKKGTWIMVEGKAEAEDFFIIRQGKVQVTKEMEVVEERDSSVLGPGDFFGVVDCMSNHPRIEGAIALTDVSIVIVKRNQFGVLIQKNTPIALKIIRSFSQKLRYFDETLTKLSFKKSVETDITLLYNIGLYYENLRNYNLAVYAYYKYLKNAPNDLNADKAKQRYQALQKCAREAMNVDAKKEGLARTFKNNTFIFCEHEPGYELYIIQSGKVKITKIVENNEVMLAVLQPGDIFGEMAILEDKPRNASAIADGDCVMLAVNRQNFEAMVAKQPQLATKLITLLAERIWLSYRKLANIMIKDPLGRLFDTLLTQALKHKLELKKAASYTFSFGPMDLLKMTGLDLNEDKKLIDNLIKNSKFRITDDGKIFCNDLEEIQKQVDYIKKMEQMEKKREAQKKLYGPR